MGIERIILGDDNTEFARKAMPFIPGAAVDFVETPEEVIAGVHEATRASRPYDLVISDYDYGPGRMNGLELFANLDAGDARRVLWTGNAHEEAIRKGAAALGLELLDKNQLSTLVGMAVSEAPLKRDGRILIYATDPAYRAAMQRVADTIFGAGLVTASADLKGELRTGQYGLVIDTSTLGRDSHGVVAHDMKYLELEEVPTVACLRRYGREIVDMAEAIGAFYAARDSHR